MPEKQKDTYEKLSKYFAKRSRSLTEKPFNPATDYEYIKSGDPEIIAAHGLSLMHRPHIENPVFKTESNRKIADLLHKTDGDKRLIAAMLLQDVMGGKPVPSIDNPNPEHVTMTATNRLFSGNVMTWAQQYWEIVHSDNYMEDLQKALPGAQFMVLAYLTNWVMEENEGLNSSIECYNRHIKEVKDVALFPDSTVPHVKEKHLEDIGATESRLDRIQQRYDAIKHHSEERSPELSALFVQNINVARIQIAAWKLKHGFKADAKTPEKVYPPGCHFG